MRLWKGRRPPMFSFEVFGVRVELEVADAELEAAVAEMIPAGWKPGQGNGTAGRFELTRSEVGYQISADGTTGIEHATLEAALGRLETEVEQFIALHAQAWVFIHSGAVAWEGRALLIPGESFSGKTSLVAALVEAGATYYSDEFAVVDREGRVHPYPRRLSLRSPDGQRGRQLHARELGGTTAEDSAEVAAVVLTHYRRGGEWRPKQLSSAQGLAAVLALTLAANERPAESMRTLRRAFAGATIVESERGEARAAAGALIEMLRG